MLNSKNYIYFIIPYFTISCSLYHLVYWNYFGLNGLTLISIQDIIKSAIRPLILALTIATFIGAVVAEGLIRLFKRTKISKPSLPDKISEESTKSKREFFRLGYIVATIVSFTIIYWHHRPDYGIIATSIGGVIFVLVDPKYVFAEDLKLPIKRDILLMAIIYLPCYSISIAVQDANDIIKNKSYKYTVRIYNSKTLTDRDTLKLDTLKFVGITEKNFVFTDMKNDKVYFMKQDSMVLSKKK